jgi:hypothetical protein
VAVLVLVLVLVGCGDPASKSAGSEAAASGEVVVLGPGTSIADGFTVPDDAVLLAAPGPSEGFNGDGPGWLARLRPQDPVSTFTDLVAQAQAAGFELGSYTVDPCYAVPDERTVNGQEHPAPFEPLPEGVEPSSIDCAATGYRNTDDGTEEITISTEQRLALDPPTSAGLIEVRQLAEGTEPRPIGTGQFDLQPLVATRVRPPSTRVAMDPPDLDVGAPLNSMAGAGGPTLAAGSRLAAPISQPICQGGFLAALDITGTPGDVFAAYVDQIRDAAADYGSPPEVTSTTLFGRRVDQAHATIDDASSIMRATMITGDDDEPTRLLLEQCNG